MSKDFNQLIIEKGTCCICSKPMKESKFISLARIDKKATWKYPVWNNVLIPGLEDRAVAIMCDGCREASEISGVCGMIKYAVETRGEKVIMHDIEELEDAAPPSLIVIPNIPDFFTGRVNDPRYGPFGEQKNPPLHWMHEQTGEMKKIVFKFMTGAPLYDEELNKMRWYLFQWVESMPAKPESFSRELIYGMTQEQLRDYVKGSLMDMGIDPL